MIKKLAKRKRTKKELPVRITNDTVAEHRERVLAGGRRHKYPVQYTKHRLVWNTIIISTLGLILAGVLVYLQLYVWRDSSDVAYRIAKLLPLPVASVDGASVPYSDYLFYQRGNMAVLKQQGQDGDADRVNFQRQRAMDQAVQDAYVRKIARERQISVSDEQVEAEMRRKQQESGMSEEAYRSTIQDQLNWSMDDVRHGVRASLLRWQVMFAVDEQASKQVEVVQQRLNEGKKLADIAQEMGSDAVQFTPSVTVDRGNQDGGITAAAVGLENGKISAPVKSLAADGYYFVQPTARDDGTITYAYLKVPLSAFRRDFDKVIADKRVSYYIKLDQPAAEQR